MLKSKYIGLLFLVLAILMACQYPSPVTLSGDMPQKKRDSVNYLMERHYTLNSNFEVTSDSIPTIPYPARSKHPLRHGINPKSFFPYLSVPHPSESYSQSHRYGHYIHERTAPTQQYPPMNSPQPHVLRNGEHQYKWHQHRDQQLQYRTPDF